MFVRDRSKQSHKKQRTDTLHISGRISMFAYLSNDCFGEIFEVCFGRRNRYTKTNTLKLNSLFQKLYIHKLYTYLLPSRRVCVPRVQSTTHYSYIPISHQKTLTNIKSNGTFLSKSPSLYCTETL